MVSVIRIELYGEYVQARMDIEQRALVVFVYSENDDVILPIHTPEHPLLSQFTQDEIDTFEFIYKKDMAYIHGDKKSPSN